ncbi:MAG: RNHCP domain-containing protein [Candidatus Pacebacteria bacterium]|nr:RNHCP domain-containing protein [Candidatus Paceibacterota bacterium]
MSLQFKKVVEDFKCEHCGFTVEGNGYTNHCPQCLWSKHVDVYPGDRLEPCQGLMKPTGVRLAGGEYIITHKCEHCHLERVNKAAPSDDISGFLSRMLE